MTSEQYVYKRKSTYVVSKNVEGKNHIFGFFKSFEEAVFARNLFLKYDWEMDEIKKLGNVIEYNGQFLVVSIVNNQLRFLDKFDDYYSAWSNSEKIIQEFNNNPFNSRYGTYIYGKEGYYYVRKTINKKEVLFGIYRDLDDATFARDLLKSNDWDMDKIKQLSPVCFSEIHGKYAVIGVFDNKLIIADKFESQNEALNNAPISFEEYKKGKYATGEKHIAFNGNLYSVNRYKSGKLTYYGSFKEFHDAVAVRDLLISVDWDLSTIYENKIYHFDNYFYKFHIFEGLVKIIGKFTSYEDAKNNKNNLSQLTYEDIYDPENRYSKVNKYITKRGGKFWIKKNIDGQPVILGPYDTREDAIDARDKYEQNGWDIGLDEESIYSSIYDYDDYFEDIVSNLSLWQKNIYDTIVRLDKTYFTFEELLNHSYLKRYKSGNFTQKVEKYLGELVDLGLVTQLEVNIFKKEF